MQYLTPEDMIAGGDAVFDISIPSKLLYPASNIDNEEDNEEVKKKMLVKLRPLTIGSFSLIMKAAKDDPSLIPLLMIKTAIVEPVFTMEQVKKLHLGLVNFLISRIREISGFDEKKNSLVS
jgi:hypothetical protein